jgi:hypothetical protein
LLNFVKNLTKHTLCLCGTVVLCLYGVQAKAAATISSVTPNIGATTGGTNITVRGTNFIPVPPTANCYSDGTRLYAPMEKLTFSGDEYINTGVTQMGANIRYGVKYYVTSKNGCLFIRTAAGNASLACGYENEAHSG